MWFDAHCHLGWFSDPVAVARDAAKRDLGLLAVTVTPDEFLALRGRLAAKKNVHLAAGLHPWWVRDASDADALCALVGDLRLVGEIGLDAAPRRAGTWDAQLAAFERTCRACAETSEPGAPKVLSVHAVRAAATALDVLERTGAAARCRCVLHWFSGTSEELWRAVRLGCRISLGERALSTRRGREYARVVPAEALLVETDLPGAPGDTGGAALLEGSLAGATAGVAHARGIEEAAARELLARNAVALLAP
ncbi:TatD family hydrolase [Olsenella sp. An290]|uniref:TatD family hydrolase n=1 Tax=Olsenella sp. An290 TaxID=1965625 RepID=UPI000B3755E6|nr:TatD family hydrolase [Olsenella sp. An290]OUO35322.1 hypothetical protein B5F84_03525 [Olsenella sp. An290]